MLSLVILSLRQFLELDFFVSGLTYGSLRLPIPQNSSSSSSEDEWGSLFRACLSCILVVKDVGERRLWSEVPDVLFDFAPSLTLEDEGDLSGVELEELVVEDISKMSYSPGVVVSCDVRSRSCWNM
jgi:hypothetical protein